MTVLNDSGYTVDEKNWREKCTEAVRAVAKEIGLETAAEEYIAEAEHQDGEEYWINNFADVDEAVEDFRTYVEIVTNPD